jgi:ABC-type antimicrobial peptide transport system permease subunit
MIAGEGERLEKERRKKFWRLVFLLGAVGGAAGFVFGFIHGAADASGQPVSGTARTMAALALMVATIGGGYFSWRFFTSADEVEVTDNLWASLIGFYVYGFAVPLWWGLWWLKVAPKPVDWIIYVVVMLSATAAYGVRKWRSR